MQLILTRTVGVTRKIVSEVCEDMRIIEKKRGFPEAHRELEKTQSHAYIAVQRLF